MDQKKTLAKNTILIGLAKTSAALVSFLLLPVMTAHIGTEDYGLLDLVISYSGLIIPLVVLSLDLGIFRFLIDARGDEDRVRVIISTVIRTVLPIILLGSLIFIIVASLLQLKLAWFILLYLLSALVLGVVQAMARGLGKNGVFAIGSMVSSILTIVGAVVALLVFQGGLEGIFVAYIGAQLVGTLITIIPTKTYRYISMKKFDAATRKELLGYSLPLVPNSISWWVFNVSDRTIIAAVLGTSANGIYAVSNRFSGILSSIQGVLYTSWMEASSMNINSKSRDSFFSSVFNNEIRIFVGLATLLLAGLAIGFNWLVAPDYNEAYIYVPVLVIGNIFNLVVGFYSAIYAAKKMTKKVLSTSIVAAAINLVVNLGLVWFIGVWAAAISTAVAYMILAIYRHFDMKKTVKVALDKGLVAQCVGLFGLICVLYYINIPWLNIVSLAVAIAGVVALNWHLIMNTKKAGVKMLLQKTRKK